MSIDPSHLDRLMGDDWQSSIPPVCPTCGYNLTGLTTNRCPECGHVFLRKEIKKEAANLRALMQRAEEVKSFVNIGFKVALVGAALLLTGTLLGMKGGTAGIIGRTLGFLCGFVALSMGMTIQRVYRLPPWARHGLKDPPKIEFALATIVISVALLVLAFIPL
jgi:predicted RNA-binding Zn-ribbon protein involved in translation (DUF1610 family)